MSSPLLLNRVLNRSFLRNHEETDTKERFRLALETLLKRLNDDVSEREEEEHSKTWIHYFLTGTFYAEPYLVNTSKKTDQAIFGPDSPYPWILMEMKSPRNKDEMPRDGRFDRKGFCQLVLYYLKEERERTNQSIKHLIVTNGFEWYVFERRQFYHFFGKNRSLWNDIQTYEREGKTREELYDKVIAPRVREVQEQLQYVYINLRQFEGNVADPGIIRKRRFEVLCKFFSPTHLCMLPYQFDHNNLDTRFYNELLYIMGVEERKVGLVDKITRLPEKKRQHYSLLEQAIWHLTELGIRDEEELYETAMGLVIAWINRILFLKLLETQLVNFNGGNKRYGFLSPARADSIKDYHALFDLFFKVLSKTEKERNPIVRLRYELVPYLNSALFEVSELEKHYFTINALPHGSMKPFKTTVLKDAQGRVLSEKIDSLEYLLRFLDAYDFGSYETDEEEVTEGEQKTLIDASVLGLIFEKINGYKEGAYFTPGYVCEYICHETIERVVLERFNTHFDWQCESIDDIISRLDYHNPKVRRTANDLINSIRICDPSVGSGHFLVSALNELISIKDRLHILEYSTHISKYAGQRVKGWDVYVADDELTIVSSESQKPFVYDRNNDEACAMQSTLFAEKRQIISNCLYGVDVNPKSVDICRLRLWIELLKNAYYKDGELQTLPNIDLNVKQGDALMSHLEVRTGAIPGERISRATDIKAIVNEYRQMIHLYKQGTGQAERFALSKKLHDIKLELRSYVQKDFSDYLMSLGRGDQLAQNYFEWMIEFPELLDDEAHFRGFDIVVGNPPYIGLGADNGRLRKRYIKCGFKTFSGKGDIYFLFYERALQILHIGGLLCFITSDKWLRNDAAKQLRNHLLQHSQPLLLLDFPGVSFFKRAVVINNILMARKEEGNGKSILCATTEGKDIKEVKDLTAFVSTNRLHCQFQTEQQWLVLPDESRSIMQKMLETGKPLDQWEGVKARRGVVTGRNQAFIISSAQREQILANCRTEEERQRTISLLKPVIDGDQIHRYQHTWSDKWIIASYPALKLKIENYPAVQSYLLHYAKDWLIEQGHPDIAADKALMEEFGRLYLEQNGKEISINGNPLLDINGQPIKSRKRTSHRWFETSDSIAFYKDFLQPKIVWGNLNKRASCSWITEEIHVNAPAVMVTPGSKYLLAALNSRLADFFMQNIAVVRNGGYYEYKPQFVNLIPLIETPTPEDKVEIERLVDQVLQGDAEAERQIDKIFTRMYGLTEEEETMIMGE